MGRLSRPERARGAALVALAVVAEQLGGPDLGVEDDVVLAHEVVGVGVRRLPPLPPRLGVAGAAGPLDRRRQVADDGVEPDVDALVRPVAPAVQRHRHAPVDVAGVAARLEVLEQVDAEVQDVGPPALAGGQPVAERAGEGRQVEEVVLALDELRRLAVDLADRVDQVDRVELVAAVVALVAAGAVVAADRAGALDVAVGQRAAGRRADRAERRLREDVAVLQQAQEDLLADRGVVGRRRPGEEVVAQPERLQVVDDDPVVPVGDLPGRDALGVGRDGDRRAVLVGAADHQHPVAGHPVVAAEDVGGDAEAGDVADVPRAVGVGPGDCGQDVPISHGSRVRRRRPPGSPGGRVRRW